MGESTGSNEQAAAQAMLDLFASVGATRFDLTLTTSAGDKDRFRRGVQLDELRRTLPALLETSARTKRNVIVRPSSPSTTFIQLDDLRAEQLPKLATAAFLSLETSPGNFQAWIALEGMGDRDFARRLRKGFGADATASGATRVAGSLNFKDKYAPAYPRIAIHAGKPGRRTTAEELERMGLVAPPEIAAPSLKPARVSRGTRKWPSYAICLDGAPLNSEESGPDQSRADFVWCMTALSWGFGREETTERLMEESAKAQKNGKAYADLTVRNALAALERRRQQPKRHGIG